MPVDKGVQKLTELASGFECPMLIITGGEPGLYDDFSVIMETAACCFPRVTLTTNGTFNDSFYETIDKYKKLLTVQVSLDGTREVHDAIRGNGVFDLAVSNIKRLVREGYKVTVSSTLHSENIKSMFSLADIISGLKIQCWHISPEQTFEKTTLKRMLDVSVWNSFVNEIINYAQCRISIRKLFDFLLFEKAEEKYGKDFLRRSVVPNCGIGQTKVYIYPDFCVVPCTCMPDMVIGNLLEDSVIEIKKRLNALRCNIETSSSCYSCRWNYLCNGGCPGYSYHLRGKIGFGDIRCPLVKEDV